jgi:hypothetical protein
LPFVGIALLGFSARALAVLQSNQDKAESFTTIQSTAQEMSKQLAAKETAFKQLNDKHGELKTAK